MSPDSPTITREHAARLLGTSERHVRRLIQQGRLALEPDAHGALVLRERAVLELASQSREVVTQLEAANRLGCGRRTIRRMLDDGRLKAIPTPGGHDRVTIESINARLADGPNKPDRIGHKEDITGHSPATATLGGVTGQIDLLGASDPDRGESRGAPPLDPPADGDELIPLLDERWPMTSASPPAARGVHAVDARRGRHGARLITVALLLAIMAIGVVFLSTRGGAKHASRATTSAQSLSQSPRPRHQRLHRPAVASHAVTPPARGGPAIPVTQPVPRTPPAPPIRTRTPRAIDPPDTFVTAPKSTRAPSARDACLYLYSSDGLC
jgi:excisionase family DNA binding protein